MVEDLIRRARRRLIVNNALSQSALACAFAIGGLALILLIGTRYLEWWTLTLFAAAGIAVGLVRIRRSIPTEYATAVRCAFDRALFQRPRGPVSRIPKFSAKPGGSGGSGVRPRFCDSVHLSEGALCHGRAHAAGFGVGCFSLRRNQRPRFAGAAY